MSRRFVRNGDWIERSIRDQHLLIPIARSEADLDSFYTLNETAQRIWTLAGEGHTEDEIATALAEEFSVELAEAAADVRRILDELTALGALKESA